MRDRLEHLHHGLQVDRAVLGVDQQPVEPDRRQVLGEERAAGREPHSEGRLALSPELLHSIGAHGDDSSGARRFGGRERRDEPRDHRTAAAGANAIIDDDR